VSHSTRSPPHRRRVRSFRLGRPHRRPTTAGRSTPSFPIIAAFTYSSSRPN